MEQRKLVTENPENSETPMDAVYSWVTPTRLFFVRNHAEVPRIDADAWRLRIGGCVRRPLELTVDELQGLPQRSLFATVECAGNGRSYLVPPEHGVQWGPGAIAHAEWTGVPLAHVLEQAELEPDVVELVFEGADTCTEPDSPEPMRFARGLPLEKALHPDTLLTLRMNGELLEPSHGYPVRLIVPGWYGVASVKWLTHISAAREPFAGYFQTKKYTIRRSTAEGGETAVGVRGMAVKSEIIRPRHEEELRPGVQRIFGLAWAGEHPVKGVQVSTDGGASWQDAQLLGPRAEYSWTLWEYYWEEVRPGDYTLLARATSASGEVQPAEHDPLRGGYMINLVRAREVRIADTSPAAEPQRMDAESLLYDMNAFAEQNASLPLDVEVELIAGAGI